MTIPIHHSPGDLEHTIDHNLIVDRLTDHASDIGVLESDAAALPGLYMSKSGNNTVNVANPAGNGVIWVVPAGTRNTGAFVMTAIYAGKPTFVLDAYGQLRAGPAADDLVPAEIFGASSTQSADLLRFRKNAILGDVVSRVDANGNFYAPNITPTPWTNLDLAGGIVPNYAVGTAPMYRTIGDIVYLRGAVKKTDNTNFATSPVAIGTLPGGYRPVYLTFAITGAQLSGNYAWVRMEVGTNGLVQFYFPQGAYQPTWVSLDGLQFSRTPGP